MNGYSTYDVERCNALGRALPKLRKRVIGPSGPKAESPAWNETYHVHKTVLMEWRQIRRDIAAACEPWFDDSSYDIEVQP